MRTVVGAGCWPGEAEGPVVWLEGGQPWPRDPVPDRAAEVLRFRTELSRAVMDLDGWSEQQETVAARLALQEYRDALLEDAWGRRVCSLIDTNALPAAAACTESAQKVALLLARSDELRERASHLLEAANWLAGRLHPVAHPAQAVLAAPRLGILHLLDRELPALVADAAEPPVRGKAPLVWGVPGLGPNWDGRRVALSGTVVRLDVPDHRWWHLSGELLQGHPACHLNGDLEALGRMARRMGQKPAAIIGRLDDLAAVPLFVAEVAAIAVDLDKLGPAPRLKHPGVALLLKASAAVAATSGVPMLAGGEPAAKTPERWLSLGFTGFYGARLPQGGPHSHALRRRKEGSL